MLTQNTNPAAHVAELSTIFHFRAPDHPIRPAVLKAGQEVVEVVTGGEVFFADESGERRRYGAGALFWHQAPEATIYETTSQAPYRCWAFRFAVTECARPVPRVGVWRQPDKLEELCTEILDLFTEGADRRLLGVYAYGILLRQYCAIPGADGGPIPAKLARILRFVNDRHGCDCPLAELLRIGGVGQAQLFRLFRVHLRCTPHEYILRKRMAHARQLLLSSTSSIKETAAECGYANIEVFYRNFRTCNAMTPGEFLKNHRRR
ncbi:MAG: helix-turn-helix transcriptional regulator [Lentisphaeria bacterium]|nr:helix-turn-helix transcriptional regulator [Lentisphaeria bacterium]